MLSSFALVAAAAECRVNGQLVQCPDFSNLFASLSIGFFIVWAVLLILTIASEWTVYTKAGQPGWAILIPIYNILVWLQIVNRPWWWIFLLIIPFVNIVISIIILYDLAKAFGKGVGFTLGLLFLGIIFLPILAFGNSQYTRPVRS